MQKYKWGQYRHIHVEKAHSEKGEFTLFNLQAMSRAMKELKPSTFKLWCYLNKNKGGYEFSLSQKAVENFCGISRNTYQAAFQELYEKGYLTDFVLPRLDIEGFLFLEDAAQNRVMINFSEDQNNTGSQKLGD